MGQKKFIVWGPDQIPIRQTPFNSLEAAERGLREFVARFHAQGYYAGVGFQLPLSAIASHCRIEEVKSQRGT